MRPLDEVMQAVISCVPRDFPEAQDLQSELASIVRSYRFAAPEMHVELWHRAVGTVARYLGDPTDVPWKMSVKMLISGDLDYRSWNKIT